MLDERDRRIISALREDARLPIRTIAQRTGLRPSTVHQRIARMRADGVIERFTIKTRPDAVGEALVVFMLIKSERGEKIPEKTLQDPRIKEVFGVTGTHDLLLKMRFRDVQAFNDFVMGFREQHRVDTMTLVGTATIKEEL